jgi:hypothetical protein
MQDAIDLLHDKRRDDGRWPVELKYSGKVFFEMEKIGGRAAGIHCEHCGCCGGGRDSDMPASAPFVFGLIVRYDPRDKLGRQGEWPS